MVGEELQPETEVLVVGGGPGGYTGAIRAAQRGYDVTLVEDAALGGVCLNEGCIPSKALLTATARIHAAATSEHMGIYGEPYVDVDELTAWVDDVVDRLEAGIVGRCDATGVRLVAGRAAFEGSHTARVVSDGTELGAVEFEHAILATGSRPRQLPGFPLDDDRILDSERALAVETVPERLVIVGAGYVGMELSTVYARLGTDVTVVEALDDVLPRFPRKAVEPVRRQARELGISIHRSERATGWHDNGSDIDVTTEGADGEEHTYTCDRALVAVGREPVTETVALENVGLSTDEHGYVETDETGRTDRDHVFCVGDVAGEPMLAHKASREGLIAADAIAGCNPPVSDRAIPAVVFTDPEIATVGLSESDAARAGYDVVSGTCPSAAIGRALTADAEDGHVTVVADGATNEVLGGHVVGAEASELVSELAVATAAEATLETLATTVRPHPTLSEAVGEAARRALGTSTHLN